VSVGNNTAVDSFNNTGGAAAAEGDPALAAETDTSDTAATAGDAVETAVDAALDASDTAVDAATSAAEPVAEPAAEALTTDMTASADSYESDDAGMVVEDAFVEEPVEEQ
jgi:hypothetical protein